VSRFLLDENVSPSLADVLRHDGHDAVHVNHVGLARGHDEVIMVAAAREGRTVITHDHDYVDNLRVLGATAPSVIKLVQDGPRGIVGTEAIAARLRDELPALESRLTKGAAVTLHRDGAVIRHLPLAARPPDRALPAVLQRARERQTVAPDRGRGR